MNSTTDPVGPVVPLWAQVHLTHAALQAIADGAGVDLLHIKGPTDAALRSRTHVSSDADVLVRPAHIEAFTDALAARGWSLYSDFADGSPFGHAANYEHPAWTRVDVHRALPGVRMRPDDAFERLWAERATLDIGHRPCTVPSLPARVLVQTLHVARSHGYGKAETWANCPDGLRPDVRALVADLGADTPFAAAVGELEKHRDRDDYALWAYWSGPDDDRLAEWIARLRAAESARARVRILSQVLRVNRTHLRLRLGREPGIVDLLGEQAARVRKACRAAARILTPRA